MKRDSLVTNGSGQRIYFDPADERGKQLAASGGNLTPLSLALWNIALGLRKWDLVVDVGCNYGEMLVSAKLPVGPEVVAFEPNPKVLPYLKRTLSDFGRPVTLIKRAVADVVRDSAPFVVDEVWSGTSGLPRHISDQVFGHDHKRVHISVPVTTLDAEFAECSQTSVCIKIDVEGHELAVLTGARKLLDTAPNWAVVLEILHMPENKISELASTYALYVLNKQSNELVRLRGDHPHEIALQLASNLLYPQDALIISSPSLLDDNDTASAAARLKTSKRAAQLDSKSSLVNSGKLLQNSTPKRVAYTALIGRYERLNDQPVAASSNVDFVCFTDDPQIVSDTWIIRFVEPRFPRDSIRSARYLKIMGPELFNDYDESLWIDNSVLLKAPPEHILDEWLATADFAAPLHSFRDSVAGEFDAVDAAGYDDPARLYEQLITYAATCPSVLREKPYSTNLLARRHTTGVRAAMQFWYEQILRYSRRDQLSLNYALSVSSLATTGIALDLLDNAFFQWPISHERKTSVTRGQLGEALRIPYAEIGRLENTVASLRAALAEGEIRRSEVQISEATLRDALDAALAEIAALRAELAQQEQDHIRWRQQQIGDLSAARNDLRLIESSTSWRMVIPIRWIGARLSARNRRMLRRVAQAVWWSITPHHMLERIRYLRTRP